MLSPTKVSILGRVGGWDSRDHDIFLKVWTQLNMKLPGLLSSMSFDDIVHRTIDELPAVANQGLFVRKLCKLLPSTTEVEIIDHIAW